jgi:hypothetical protein
MNRAIRLLKACWYAFLLQLLPGDERLEELYKKYE